MLTFPIKKKWFDMILSGEKKEEYREIKKYYISRLLDHAGQTIEIKFRNGYSNESPYIICNCVLKLGKGKTDWGAVKDEVYFILHIMEIVEIKK